MYPFSYKTVLSFKICLYLLFSIVHVSHSSQDCMQYGMYRCQNARCVPRNEYCNYRNDCGDNTDEIFCSYNRRNYRHLKPSHFKYFECKSGGYIPDAWVCDGIKDCADHSDEVDCNPEKIPGMNNAMKKAVLWIEKEGRKANGLQGGSVLPRGAVSLYLSDEDYFTSGNSTAQYITKELTIQLLGALLRNETERIKTNELAMYVHALLASCIDPRDFFDKDLVSILRQEINRQSNYTNPYVLIALCNAGGTMVEKDVRKLATLVKESHEPLWTDIQALAMMALVCINNQKSGPMVNSTYLSTLSRNLKKLQRQDGSVQSLHTTGLVLQALSFNLSMSDEFRINATKYIMRSQEYDGSFKNLINTYSVLPILNFKSLNNISFEHCPKPTTNDNDNNHFKWENKARPHVNIIYSLWFGDKKDLKLTLAFKVDTNKTLLHAMKEAASFDNKFRFDYSEYKSNAHVYSISGIQNDPENDKFWFLLKYEPFLGEFEFQSESLTAIKLHENDFYVMWFRTSPWSEEHNRTHGQTVATEKITTVAPEETTNYKL